MGLLGNLSVYMLMILPLFLLIRGYQISLSRVWSLLLSVGLVQLLVNTIVLNVTAFFITASNTSSSSNSSRNSNGGMFASPVVASSAAASTTTTSEVVSSFVSAVVAAGLPAVALVAFAYVAATSMHGALAGAADEWGPKTGDNTQGNGGSGSNSSAHGDDINKNGKDDGNKSGNGNDAAAATAAALWGVVDLVLFRWIEWYRGMSPFLSVTAISSSSSSSSSSSLVSAVDSFATIVMALYATRALCRAQTAAKTTMKKSGKGSNNNNSNADNNNNNTNSKSDESASVKMLAAAMGAGCVAAAAAAAVVAPGRNAAVLVAAVRVAQAVVVGIVGSTA